MPLFLQRPNKGRQQGSTHTQQQQKEREESFSEEGGGEEKKKKIKYIQVIPLNNTGFLHILNVIVSSHDLKNYVTFFVIL